MLTAKGERAITKEHLLDDINAGTSPVKRYGEFYVGSGGIGALIRYEIVSAFLSGIPGALGLVLRKAFYPSIMRQVGSSAVWGRNIVLRHPGRISVGDRTAIDDHCMLDAKGGGEIGIQIGSDVLIARSTIIQTKGEGIVIGDHSVIGSQCYFGSVGGIHVGQHVMISGQCYFGGGRYKTDDVNTPIMKQQLYSKGTLVIEDDVWIGAGAIIQDGVTIGRGSVIGSGALIREDVPPMTVVVPNQRLVMLPREKAE
jgi:acetyltransferase-like isoleucine patch superfamily enzyme